MYVLITSTGVNMILKKIYFYCLISPFVQQHLLPNRFFSNVILSCDCGHLSDDHFHFAWDSYRLSGLDMSLLLYYSTATLLGRWKTRIQGSGDLSDQSHWRAKKFLRISFWNAFWKRLDSFLRVAKHWLFQLQACRRIGFMQVTEMETGSCV